MKRESQKAARAFSSALESRGAAPNDFSMVPLLLANRDISAGARRALVENRLQDAAELLMDEHGLSCIEAGHLLDVFAC